jgi:UDP-glucose 4-epimerase
MPYLLRVAINNNTNTNLGKEYNEFKIFGNDYTTKDKTCIRDYIHVVDLAKAHVKSLNIIDNIIGNEKINVGTGKGTSVLELINTFQNTNNIKLQYTYTNRRDGDLENVYCNANKATELLKWKSEKTIEDICKDAWNWQKNNPNGY